MDGRCAAFENCHSLAAVMGYRELRDFSQLVSRVIDGVKYCCSMVSLVEPLQSPHFANCDDAGCPDTGGYCACGKINEPPARRDGEGALLVRALWKRKSRSRTSCIRLRLR